MAKEGFGDLRDHVLWLLEGGEAHCDFTRATSGTPPKCRGARVPNCPHTPWRLVEHLRTCQHDLLHYSSDPGWESPAWPEGYWPAEDAPPNDRAWDAALAAVERDAAEFRRLVAERDLLAPLPHAPQHTLLRQALIVADHNAYTIGQLVLLRQALGCWHRP